jgi:hypothetical protein
MRTFHASRKNSVGDTTALMLSYAGHTFMTQIREAICMAAFMPHNGKQKRTLVMLGTVTFARGGITVNSIMMFTSVFSFT